MTEDNTWGEDEENIIASVKAHRDWFTKHFDDIRDADNKRIEDLRAAGFENPAHAQLPIITNNLLNAEKNIKRYRELGEDKEGNVSGHLRHGTFANLNNFHVTIGHRLGLKEVFTLGVW